MWIQLYLRVKLALGRKWKAPIPIAASKYNCLQDLKEFIPSDFHSFYDQLSHKYLNLSSQIGRAVVV